MARGKVQEGKKRVWKTPNTVSQKTQSKNCLGCYHIGRFQLLILELSYLSVMQRHIRTLSKHKGGGGGQEPTVTQSVFSEVWLFFFYYLTRQNKDAFLQGEDVSCRYKEPSLLEILLHARYVKTDTASGKLGPGQGQPVYHCRCWRWHRSSVGNKMVISRRRYSEIALWVCGLALFLSSYVSLKCKVLRWICSDTLPTYQLNLYWHRMHESVRGHWWIGLCSEGHYGNITTACCVYLSVATKTVCGFYRNQYFHTKSIPKLVGSTFRNPHLIPRSFG